MPVQYVVQKLESSGILPPIRPVFVLNVDIGITGLRVSVLDKEYYSSL
ncbi:MAG: hypothetical protein ACTSVF_04200 [Candidatus Asgardarchaeia archaeon]